MQKIKRKTVDAGLCDRRIAALKALGISSARARDEMDLQSRSVISEIARRITEPSKRIISYLVDNGISAQWIYAGAGPQKWEEIKGSQNEIKKLRKENSDLKKSILLSEGTIRGIKDAIGILRKRAP